MSAIPSTTTAAQEHRRWHERVEARRTSPYGPLSATALEWLVETPARFEGVPGSWRTLGGGRVEVAVTDEEVLTLEGTLLAGSVILGPLTGTDSVTLDSGDLRVEVAARGDAIALRPRHPDSSDRREYRGTPTFPYDDRWVVRARWIPTDSGQVTVPTVIDRISQQYASPGIAEFVVAGQPLRLTLFHGVTPGTLRALFADATGSDLTFPASRSVEVLRDGDDLVIDFNRATNPPCAYSAHATCPLPPAENRLSVRIEAGELRPPISAAPA